MLNKKILFLVLWGMVTHVFAQQSPSNTGNNTFNYQSDQLGIMGMVGEAFLGQDTALTVSGKSILIGFPYNLIYTQDAFDGGLFASKGYYSDFVKLQWELYSTDLVTKISIYRKKLSESDELFRPVTSLSSEESTYQDVYAEPGQMYAYKVIAEGVWDTEIIGLNRIDGVGFRVTSATVTGRITYKGGNIVKGVKVFAEPEIPDREGEYAYQFPDHVKGNYGLIIPQTSVDLSNGVSIQTWVKPTWPNGKQTNPVFSLGNSLSFGFKKDSDSTWLYVSMGSTIVNSMLVSDSIQQEFMQLSLSWDDARKTAHLYLNGADFLTAAFPNKDVGQSNWYIGGAIMGGNTSYFSGIMDEVKLWKKAQSDEEVFRSFDAYENPNNPDLVGYWKMNEGGGRNFYDISRLNSNFNENHALVVSDNNDYVDNFTTTLPSTSRLGYKAVTDENGNYVIAGIAFASGGSYFRVVPSMGIHRFDPTNKLLYISQESSVFNNIDFTDASSFRVTGRVMYKGTKYPVRDVYLKVDGVIVSDEKKQPIKTDNQGEFEIDVPIGQHYISIEKNGHVFESAYWPALDEYGNPDYYDFQDDVYGREFSDTTMLTLVGKIVGGPIQGQKQTGSKTNPSLNNIGQVKVTLTTERGVDLWNNDPTVSFTTDANDGTYKIKLLPEKFIIQGLPSTINPGVSFNRASDGLPLDMSNKFIPQYTIDSIFMDTIINKVPKALFVDVDTVLKYNHNRDWVWRSSPKMKITNKNDSVYWGESTYNFNVRKDSSIIIPLVNRQSDGSYTYLLDNPVFNQLSSYELKVSVVEPYTNVDNGNEVNVPVTDGIVMVENQFANTNKSDIIELDEQGLALHSFVGGMPLEAEPYTKNINFKLKIGDNYIPGAEITQSCYMLGGKLAGGLNFVTGPDEIDFILRDPPGSNSYSYFEKGFTVSKTTVNSSVNGFGGDVDLLYMMGVEFATEAGSPFFSIETKIETDNTIGLSTSNDFKWNDDNTFSSSKTYQFNFSTSDNPLFVGEMGDVFFGHGTNIYYGAATNVKIVRDELGNYKVGNKKALIVGKSATTDFVFTQNHIENYLIPNLRRLRNQLLDSVVFISHLHPSDERYGLSNTDPVFNNISVDTTATTISGPSFDFVPQAETPSDSIKNEVEEYNLLINHWKKILAKNELLKLTASSNFDTHNNFTNLSFDAGASIESSITSDSTDATSSSFEWSVDAGVALQLGFTINKFGYKVNAKERYHHSGGDSETNGDTNTKKIGFVLKDDDIGDYFSVDVKKDKVFASPVFILRGGQSSCPAEPGFSTRFLQAELKPVLLSEIDSFVYSKIGDYSWDEKVDLVDGGSPISFDEMFEEHKTSSENKFKPFYEDYYKPGEIISHGTLQRESPLITAKTLSINNVPEGQKAEFIVYLSNTSDADMDAWYGLFVDPASNPDGAIVRVDGKALVGGLTVLVPAGKTVTKAITIEKGRTEVNTYEGLDLIMHSLCQFDPTDDVADIADTLTLSVEFAKSCTEIAIISPLDKWVVNTSPSFKKESGRYELPVQFGNYDLNHGKFTSFIFQYKFSEGNQWNTVQTFVNGMTGEDTTDIAGNSTVNYIWDMTDVQNRDYDIRAISYCSDGSIYESEVLSGIYDNKPPMLFGAPQPADGILSVNDEIILSFDEEIQAGIFGKANISLTGIQNGTDLRDYDDVLHDASIHFDGLSQNMTIAQNINLKYSPFTIEFWAKRERTGVKECLISQGDPNNGGLWIGFNAEDHFMMTLNGSTVVSKETFTTTGIYNHYAAVYDNSSSNGASELRLVVASNSNTDITNKIADVNYFGSSALTVGSDNGTSAFMGNMHHLHIWNQSSTSSEIGARRYTIVNGYEKGLIGAWAMDDAFGSLAKDVAFARHGMVNASWSISKIGSAFNSTGGYALFSSASMEMTSTSDFTIEFWFKSGTPSDDEYLMSNGKADGSDSSPLKWAIKTTKTDSIIVMNDGKTFGMKGATYLNNQWHHMAISVNRRGNMTVYMDGNSVLSESHTQVTGMGGAYIALGGRYYYTTNATQTNVDKTFSGSLDEVRIWNAARSQNHIQSLMNHSLRGDEKGLKAYFPFEDVSVMDPSVNNQTMANMTMDENSIAGDCVFNGSAAFTLETPGIKVAQPLSEIPFDYTINGNRILITPNIDASRIENVILDIAVDGVYDMHGNRMEYTAGWSAFVDKNQLVWENQEISLESTPEDPLEFTLTIANKGGTREYWQIENLPVWLTADMETGTLDPQSTDEITFKVSPVINVGQFSHDIYLNGSLDYNERCKINLLVIDKAPEWTVNEGLYENSMSIIGELRIVGELSTDINDIVGVFIDDECRGLTQVQYLADRDLYYVNLTVFGNAADDDTALQFKVWDASTGNTYTDVSPKDAEFSSNGILGSPKAPVNIATSNNIGIEIPLAEGWNWISFNLASPQLQGSNNLLSDIESDISSLLKREDGKTAEGASDGKWYGVLEDYTYTNTEMYKLKISTDDTIRLSGMPLNTANFQLQLVNNAWTWIGYTPRNKMPLKSALSYLSPAQDDLIKSQSQFAMYDSDLGWIGSLRYMKPHEGYMYKSNSSETVNFVYPQETLFKSEFLEEEQQDFTSKSENNMSAIIGLKNNPLSDVSHGELLVLYQDAVIGRSRPIYTGRSWIFAPTISGAGSNAELSFVLRNTQTQELYAAREKSAYEVDGIVGSVSKPLLLSFALDEKEASLSVMPNPFRNEVIILDIPEDVYLITIYDVHGRLIKSWSDFKSNRIVWDGNSLDGAPVSSGAYLLNFVGSGMHPSITIIKQGKH